MHFADCKGLKKVIFPANNKYKGEIDTNGDEKNMINIDITSLFEEVDDIIPNSIRMPLTLVRTYSYGRRRKL